MKKQSFLFLQKQVDELKANKEGEESMGKNTSCRFFGVLPFIVGIIIFQGCKDEKETGCRPLPLDADVSWTEYNSIERLNTFYCNKDALERHKGDTIRFYGWVYIRDTNSSDPDFGDWTADRNYIHLVPIQNHYAQSIILKWDSLWLAHHSDFCSHFDEYLDKKWYVTATIDYDFFGTRCCSTFPIFWAVSIDSI